MNSQKEGNMAKVELHPLFKEFRGALGDMVFRVTPGGKTYVSQRPDMSNVKWSEAQKAHRQRFKEASAYARAALADPDVRAVYEKRATEENRAPYRVALSDYLKGNDLLAKK
jgi:hypothetical protein